MGDNELTVTEAEVLDWEDFEADTAEQKVVVADKSLTASVRDMLYTTASDDRLKEAVGKYLSLPQFKTIYEVAKDEDLTLQEFVQKYPEDALRIAENSYSEWQEILTTAALKGAITLADEMGDEHDYQLSKNQTKLIEVKVRETEKHLATVNEFLITSYRDEDKRKDALERSMYKRALKGDTRLAIYLHDRVDGRPTEAKTTEFDYDNAYNVYQIIHTLFKQQLDVINAGNGTVLICCSRRAGKTHLLVALLLIECLRKPRTKCMYIGETMELSENLVNKAANDIIEVCQLKDKHGKRLNWKKLDNGSEIMIRGLSNTKDPDQIRGQAAKVIVIDEFFHLKSELLEYMQREVLEPMQLDYADGYKFICAGTPPKIKGTYGEYVWKNWDVPHFSWTWRDNPHPVNVEARKAYVDKILKEKGLDWSSTFARREYNGEWAYDDDLLLYPECHTYNPREAIPTIIPSRILFGIDYGVGDNDTIFGIVWNDDEKRGYQFWEDKFNRLDIMDREISQLEYLCEQIRSAWRTALDMFPGLSPREANKRILWDADDNDQHLTDYINVNLRLNDAGYEDLRINVQNAHKTDRAVMYDLLRDCLRKGDLLLIEGGKAQHEVASTVLKRGPNGEIYKEIDDKIYHPDLLPAMRYAMYNAIGV